MNDLIIPRQREPLFPNELIKDYLVSAALHEYEKVCFLIEHRGLYPDCTLPGKPSALCYVVLKPNHCLMRYLLDKGASIRFQDAMGMTPLHYAVLGGCEYCVATMILHGASVTVCNKKNQSPLDLARSRPNLGTCAEYLARCGAGTGESHRFH